MILVLGGTTESREAVAGLVDAGFQVLVLVATEYGRKALNFADKIEVIAKPCGLSDLLDLIENRGIRAVVDCTHPFAAQVSHTAMLACDRTGISYIRLERETLKAADYPGVIRTPDFEAAARLVASLEGTVMLTIGVKHLPIFIDKRCEPNPRLVARVLPHPDSVARCLACGLAPEDIVALKGPFSVDFNRALFIEYGVTAVVTKESGTIGGTDAKLEAAAQLGIKSVLIERPRLNYSVVADTLQDVICYLFNQGCSTKGTALVDDKATAPLVRQSRH
ncbi:MAG TPA: precorrin-6A reductase [Syntrophothermus lipocalidus]|nr:precorrin-6A reductase [Syntrophothermus lipocalidus]